MFALKNLLLISFIVLTSFFSLNGQVIPMEKKGGVYYIPCKVNGLGLKFIFDTGASVVFLSSFDASIMLKRGFLKAEDLGKTEYFQIADGTINEGTKVVLREIEIGQRVLYDVEATIVNSIDAPLLLGQSVLERLGEYTFDYSTSSLIIKKQSDKIDIIADSTQNGDINLDELFKLLNGHLEDSVLRYDRLIELQPHNDGFHFKRGDFKFELRNIDGAIEDYNTAIELNPKDPNYFNQRGKCRHEQEKYESAIKNFTQSIELDSNLSEYYFNRANSKFGILDLSGAIEDYSIAIRLNPELSSYYSGRAFLKNLLNDYEGAIIDYSMALKLDPNSSDCYMNRAMAKEGMKDNLGAIDDYTKAIEISSDQSPYLYVKRGKVKLKVMQLTSACLDFKKAKELDLTGLVDEETIELIKQHCN
jgi:clan AA aspartic protease (TIGR02281 family)